MSNGGLGFGKRKLVNAIIEEYWPDHNIEEKKFSYSELLFIIQEMGTNEGKKYLEGEKRQKGFTIFKMFMQHLLYRNIANYDSMILLTATKGAGKSSAAIMMGREWMRLLGRRFNPQKHIAYSNQDLMQKIDAAEKFDVIVADESYRFISSADWAKKENKELKKKLAEVRTKHLLFILCFPMKVSKVESSYMDSFINIWIDLYGRGRGSIFMRDKNPVNDPWRLKDFKNVGSYNEFTSQTKIEEKLKKHPNFWSLIHFPKPAKAVYDKYLEVREANVYNDAIVRASVGKEDLTRALLIMALKDIMKTDTNLDMKRIILHIKTEYDIHLSKPMVQAILEDAANLVAAMRDEELNDNE